VQGAVSTENNQRITIAVDALGGDDAPAAVLDGAALALAQAGRQGLPLQLILAGPGEVVQPFAAEHDGQALAQPTTQAIAMDEHPASAVRSKKDSSIVVGCRLVREGVADGFFSAGSTGACMAAATLVIGRIKGIERPAIATLIPAPKGTVLLLDSGANADVKPEYLRQFALMGACYLREVLGAEARIGLLNIGSEEGKGSILAQEAYPLLSGLPGFLGNAEGHDIFSGRFNCIVTDGFTGNVVLKTIEGAVSGLFGALKGVFFSSLKSKLAAGLLRSDLQALKESLSSEAVGGALLLGVRGVAVIGHGSSTAAAIASGILTTARAATAKLPARIEAAIGPAQVG